MGINIGMLIFGLVDGSLAFTIWYCLLKAWFKGRKIGRILGVILGTLTFTTYIALFVWFNTPGVRIAADFKTIVYAAPPVLAVLLGALVILSQPPKPQKDSPLDAPDESDPEAETTAAGETL